MFRDTGPVREVPGIRGAPGWALHSPSPASRAPGEGGAGRVREGPRRPRRRPTALRGSEAQVARPSLPARARRGGSTFPRPGRGVSGHPLPAQVGVRAAPVRRRARGGGGACAAQEAELHSGPEGGGGCVEGAPRDPRVRGQGARARPYADRETWRGSVKAVRREAEGRTHLAPAARGEPVAPHRAGSAPGSSCSGMVSLGAGRWGWGPCNSKRLWKVF